MLATVQAREAALLSAQRALAARTSLAGAASFLCAQAAVLAVLIASGANAPPAIAASFLVLAAFEAVGGLTRAGATAGHAAAAARRVLEAADAPVPVPDPSDAAPMPTGTGLRFEGVTFRWAPGPAGGVRRADARYSGRRSGGPAGTVRCGQVDAGGTGAEGGGAPVGSGAAGRRRYRHAAGRRGAVAHRLAGTDDASVRRHDPRQPAARRAGRR